MSEISDTFLVCARTVLALRDKIESGDLDASPIAVLDLLETMFRLSAAASNPTDPAKPPV